MAFALIPGMNLRSSVHTFEYVVIKSARQRDGAYDASDKCHVSPRHGPSRRPANNVFYFHISSRPVATVNKGQTVRADSTSKYYDALRYITRTAFGGSLGETSRSNGFRTLGSRADPARAEEAHLGGLLFGETDADVGGRKSRNAECTDRSHATACFAPDAETQAGIKVSFITSADLLMILTTAHR
jgi:hypothetical protein